ncbi:MAG: NAD-dependent epimerase/dehydratase family protein [Acidobacteriota bacterium]|nr:NAD-dependent epimerase/dehydratase family protein [Acidobacteriota bacterium]
MTILVTGGGGFLGQAIVHKLLDRDKKVRTLNRGDYPALASLGVEQVRGDIADPDIVDKAVSGCEMVFHTAAKAGVWGSYDSYHAANITGTQNIIDACRKHGVRRLVYTSSPSVTFGGEDQEGIDETAPYPETFLAFYPRTKAEAERRVIAANDANLAVVSLRPHLIWGPGDNHLVPRILKQGRAGKLRIVGTGANLVDSVYIDNAADAHILAGEKLAPGAPIAGRNYFITNDEPMAMAELINGILAAGGVSPVTRKISVGTAYRAGRILEGAYKLFGLNGEPRMTRFVARQLGTAHWFDISAAKRDLGYRPKVSIRDGFERLGQALATTN